MESKSLKKPPKNSVVTPYKKQSSPMSSKISPGTIKSSKSPTKSNWIKANDEELLNRLKSLTIEGPNDDNCGNYMNEILQLLHDKLEAFLQEKIELRNSIKEAEEQLRMLNDNNAKNKSEIYNTNSYLTKVGIASKKIEEEIGKLDSKIAEIDEQIDNLLAHQQKSTNQKSVKHESNENYIAKVQAELQESLDNENSMINEATKEENDLKQLLKERTDKADRLRAEIEAFHAKEMDRIYSFKNVTGTIEGHDGSRSISKSFK